MVQVVLVQYSYSKVCLSRGTHHASNHEKKNEKDDRVIIFRVRSALSRCESAHDDGEKVNIFLIR